MSSEKMRAEFEAAYKLRFGKMAMGWNSVIRGYTYSHAAGAWWAWQTATPRAYGDGYRAADQTHEMDEDRIDRIAASHGDGEHYGEVGK